MITRRHIFPVSATILGAAIATQFSRAAKAVPAAMQAIGTMARQSASSVAITGGTIDGTVIGSTTPAAASIASLNGGPLAGARNRIVNGNFAVNQRVQVSGTALAAAAYGHDRWKAGVSGCTYTFTTTVPDTTITITAGTLTQIVEAANIEGGAYTLSWSGTATARIYQGSATGSYVSSPLTVTGLTAGTNTTVEFSTGTLGKVQLEPGSVATPFERRPSGAEFALCRYYFRYGGPGIGTWYLGGSSAAAQLMFDYSDMRPGVTPTISLANSAFTISDPGIANVAYSVGAMSTNSIGTTTATLNFTIGTGTQTGTPTQYHTALMNTSNVIAISKEL